MKRTNQVKVGRPTRKPKRGERRSQLSLKIRAEVKRMIDAEAYRVGWNQGATVEMLVEKQLAYQEALATLKLPADKVDYDRIKSILTKAGWGTLVAALPGPSHRVVTAWYPPDPADGPRFGFIPTTTKSKEPRQ
jgi:hypothetical protein